MTPQKKKEREVAPQAESPPVRPRALPKVIPGERTHESPLGKKPPKIRVVPLTEGVPPKDLKRRFAGNLDWLLGIAGPRRKETAARIGVSYNLLCRLVSAGVSRIDDRTEESLKRIAGYFEIPSVDHLWLGDLHHWLLSSETGRAFIDKFRPRLLEELEARLIAAQAIDPDEIDLLSRALGHENPLKPTIPGQYEEMVAAILASPKAESFKRLINDYYELVKRRITDPGEGSGGYAARG